MILAHWKKCVSVQHVLCTREIVILRRVIFTHSLQECDALILTVGGAPSHVNIAAETIATKHPSRCFTYKHKYVFVLLWFLFFNSLMCISLQLFQFLMKSSATRCFNPWTSKRWKKTHFYRFVIFLICVIFLKVILTATCFVVWDVCWENHVHVCSFNYRVTFLCCFCLWNKF